MPDLALSEPRMYFPLGILYLAGMAEEAGCEVEIADCRDGIKKLPNAKYYGFSCVTPHINQAKRMSQGLKGQTVIGGSHPTVAPEDCQGYFDYIVRGEGEETLLDILNGQYPNGGIINSSRIRDLDIIPNPAWHKIKNPFSKTLFTGARYGEGELSAPIMASRGCPYACAFCGNMLRTPVIFRSVDSIASEIFLLKIEYGIRKFRFVDDNFTIHPNLEDLCKEIKEFHISYRCHTRANFITPEKARLLRESGCEECSLGVESADDSVLKLNNKKLTVEQNKEAVRILHKSGLKVKIYWMSGLPGETDETIDKNIEFMQELKPAKWTLSCFAPYPGCDIYNNPDKYGVEILNTNFDNYWNFVFEENGKKFPGREGYIHKLKGQTIEQMTERHHKFDTFLRSL